MNGQVDVASAGSRDDLPRPAGEFLHQPEQVATFAAIRRRWRLVTGLVIAASLLTYVLCSVLPPLYSAKTSVMIDPREPKRPTVSTDPTTAMAPSEETIRKNEIAILRSRNLVEAVVARLSLDRELEFNPARRSSALKDAWDRFLRMTLVRSSPRERDAAILPSSDERAREQIVDAFLARLGTTSTDASRVIEIRFLSEDPERAARIADAIADEYISQKVSQEIGAAQLATQMFEQNIQDLNQQIRDAERAIEQIRNDRGLLSSANAKVIVEQLSELNRQLAAATGERVGAEGRLAEVASARGARNAASAASVLSSPLIQRLQAEATLLGAKIGELSTKYGENHPKIVQARAELNDLRALLDAEVAKVVNSYRNAVAVAKAKESSLQLEVEWNKRLVAKGNTSEVDIRALERETETKRNLLTQLVAKLTETKSQINLSRPEARVISRAAVPRSPSFPPKLAIMAAAFLFSATAGAILAVLLERSDGSVRSMAQIRQLTSARVLGAIPTVKRSPPTHVLREQRSGFVENLRAVWFQIDNSKAIPGKVLLITSSVCGEGKSTVAACLARMLALAGRRIAIIDADLRHPSVHRALGVRKSPGLAELIVDERELDDVLQMDAASGTYVIAAGTAVSSPADILQSPRLPQILRQLSNDFDAVIIDSPPVLAVYDANILARHVDKTVMVVRWGDTKMTTFVTALQRMSDLDIPVKGIVLSRVDSKKYRVYGSPDSEIFSRSFRKYYSSRAGRHAESTAGPMEDGLRATSRPL